MTLFVDIRKQLSDRFRLDVAFTAAPIVTNVFGASGSGKTTLLRCLAGLTRPDTGRIEIGDRPLFDADRGIDVAPPRRRVGYVFQHLALFPHLTIAGNVAYGLHGRPAPERRERVNEVAESFRIAPLLSRRPDEVSGGERQRAALARALVTDPDLLLLDEPLAALDHAIQARIMEDLRRWHERRRIPILYVTHSHREVFGLGEQVIVLEHGRLLASGSPHEVLDHPSHDVLASLAGFENVFDVVVTERGERSGTMRCRLGDTGPELEVPLAPGDVGRALRIAIRAGDILLAVEEPRGLSARNVLRGHVGDLSARGPAVVARVHAGATFVVHLTRGGAAALGLQAGDAVWLIIKTYSCRVSAG
jgi:molybdate transport system ATP-binding protein